MIYRLKIISFNYHGYTGITNKVHGLTREVDTYCYSLWVRGLFTFLKYGIVTVILLTKLISSRNHRTAACSSHTCVPLQ